MNHKIVTIFLLLLIGTIGGAVAKKTKSYPINFNEFKRHQLYISQQTQIVKFSVEKNLLPRIANRELSIFVFFKTYESCQLTVASSLKNLDSSKIQFQNGEESKDLTNVLEISSETKLFKEHISNTGKFEIKFQFFGKAKPGKQHRVKFVAMSSTFAMVKPNKEYFLRTTGNNYIPLEIFNLNLNKNGVLKVEAEALHGEGKKRVKNMIGFKGAGDVYHSKNGRRKHPEQFSEAFFFTDFREGLIGHVFDRKNSPVCYDNSGEEHCKISILVKYLNIKLDTIKFKSTVTDISKKDGVEIVEERLQNNFPSIDSIYRHNKRFYAYSENLDARYDTLVSVVPSHGNQMMKIAPGVISWSNDLKYEHQLSDIGRKLILLSSEKLKQRGMNRSKLGVEISAEEDNSYSIDVRRVQNFYPVHIRLGDNILDEIYSEKSRGYILDIDHSTHTEIVFEAMLHNISTNKLPKMYLKVCEDEKDCDPRPEKMQLVKDEKYLVPLDLINKKDKRVIRQKVMCKKDYNSKTEAQKPDFVKSKICKFIVLVVAPKLSSKSDLTNYKLKFKRISGVNTLYHNTYVKLRMYDRDIRLFNYPLLSQDRLLYLKLELIYGAVEICVNQIDFENKNPNASKKIIKEWPEDPKSNCQQYFTRNSELPGPSNLLQVTIGENSNSSTSKQGKYLIMVKSDQRSHALLGIFESRKTSDPTHHPDYIVRNIKAGQQISDKIIKGFNEYKEYKFKSPNSSNLDSVYINLIPLTNDSKFFITVKNKDEQSETKHKWFSDNHHLLIHKDDPWFSKGKAYTIKITTNSLNFKNSKDAKKELHYILKVSTNDKSNELVYGYPDVGFLHGKSKCFHTEIMPQSESIMMTKSLSTRTLSMYISICQNSQLDLPGPTNYHFEVSSETVGVNITKKEINTLCKQKKTKILYVCLYGKENQPYSVVYNFNNQRYLALPNSALYLPIPGAKSKDDYNEMNVLYFSDMNPIPSNLSVVESSPVPKTELYCNLMPYDVKNQNMNWPNAHFYQKTTLNKGSTLNEVTFTQEDIKRTKSLRKGQKFALYSTITQKKFTNLRARVCQEDDFCMDKWFRFEVISNGNEKTTRHLRLGEFFKGNLESSQVKYFWFYNTNDKIMEIEVTALSKGSLNVFFAKGKYSQPSVDQNLIKSLDKRHHLLQIDQNKLHYGSLNTIKGYFKIGVMNASSQPMDFTIQWNVEQEKILSPSLDHEFSVFAQEGINRYLELDVSHLSDLRLTVDSRNYEFELWIKYHDREGAKNQSYTDQFPKSRRSADETLNFYSSSGVTDHFLKKDTKTDVIFITLVPKQLRIEPMFLISLKEQFINLHYGQTYDGIIQSLENDKIKKISDPEKRKSAQVKIFLQNPFYHLFITDIRHEYFLQIYSDQSLKMLISPYKKYIINNSGYKLPKKEDLLEDERMIVLQKGDNFISLAKNFKLKDDQQLTSLSNLFVYFEMYPNLSNSDSSENSEHDKTHLQIQLIDEARHVPIHYNHKTRATLIENKELVFTFSHRQLQHSHGEGDADFDINHVLIDFGWNQYPPHPESIFELSHTYLDKNARRVETKLEGVKAEWLTHKLLKISPHLQDGRYQLKLKVAKFDHPNLHPTYLDAKTLPIKAIIVNDKHTQLFSSNPVVYTGPKRFLYRFDSFKRIQIQIGSCKNPEFKPKIVKVFKNKVVDLGQWHGNIWEGSVSARAGTYLDLRLLNYKQAKSNEKDPETINEQQMNGLSTEKYGSKKAHKWDKEKYFVRLDMESPFSYIAADNPGFKDGKKKRVRISEFISRKSTRNYKLTIRPLAVLTQGKEGLKQEKVEIIVRTSQDKPLLNPNCIPFEFESYEKRRNKKKNHLNSLSKSEQYFTMTITPTDSVEYKNNASYNVLSFDTVTHELGNFEGNRKWFITVYQRNLRDQDTQMIGHIVFTPQDTIGAKFFEVIGLFFGVGGLLAVAGFFIYKNYKDNQATAQNKTSGFGILSSEPTDGESKYVDEDLANYMLKLGKDEIQDQESGTQKRKKKKKSKKPRLINPDKYAEENKKVQYFQKEQSLVSVGEPEKTAPQEKTKNGNEPEVEIEMTTTTEQF